MTRRDRLVDCPLAGLTRCPQYTASRMHEVAQESTGPPEHKIEKNGERERGKIKKKLNMGIEEEII